MQANEKLEEYFVLGNLVAVNNHKKQTNIFFSPKIQDGVVRRENYLEIIKNKYFYLHPSINKKGFLHAYNSNVN